MNDYSAVKEEQAEYNPPEPSGTDDLSALLLRAEPVTGKCYVLTFSAKHSVTLADMSAQEILPVVETWTRIYASHLSPSNPLAKVAGELALLKTDAAPESKVDKPKNQLRYMQIFENKGAAMGCSNPHPHCQVWTTSTLPEEPGKEIVQMTKYRKEHGGRHLLADYVKLEMEKGERVVWQNEGFLVVCPWWAVWPFEVIVIPKRHVRALVDLTDDERLWFAEAIQEVARRYDNLFECSFPYSKSINIASLFGPGKVCDTKTRLTLANRLRYPPSTYRLHGRGGREQLFPYALLPASASFRDGAQVPCRVRADGRTPAGYHTGAGGGEAQTIGWGGVPEEHLKVNTSFPACLYLDTPIIKFYQ